MHPELVTIQQTIDRRVSAILAGRGDWLCRAGCDHCCRNLAAVPFITQAEWESLRAAVEALPMPVQEGIRARMQDLGGTAPVVCPFLDAGRGVCLVYDSRPIACRTYGFYVERDRGLYCGSIQQRVETGEYAGVVWGNSASIDAAASALGPARSLIDLFEVQGFPGRGRQVDTEFRPVPTSR